MMTVKDSRKVAKKMMETPFTSLKIERQYDIRNDIINGTITTYDEFEKRIGIKKSK